MTTVTVSPGFKKRFSSVRFRLTAPSDMTAVKMHTPLKNVTLLPTSGRVDMRGTVTAVSSVFVLTGHVMPDSAVSATKGTFMIQDVASEECMFDKSEASSVTLVAVRDAIVPDTEPVLAPTTEEWKDCT